MSDPRYAAGALRGFATRLLQLAGLAAERAQVVAEVLIEADLLVHDTHGLDMLARYLDELAPGRMAREGDGARATPPVGKPAASGLGVRREATPPWGATPT